MKKIFILIIIILTSQFLFSQSIIKGYKAIENKDFAKASDIFRKNLKKDRLATSYGYVLLNTNKDYHYARLYSGYRYLTSVKKLYDKLDESAKDKYKSKYNITQKSIDSLEHSIYLQSFVNIMHSTDTNDYDLYVKRFPNSPYLQKTKYLKDSLIFYVTTAGNYISNIKHFLATRPHSLFFDEATRIYQKKLEFTYQYAIEKLSVKDLEILKNEHSEFAKTKDSLDIYLKWSEMYEKLGKYIDNPEVAQRYNNFITTVKHPYAFEKLLEIIEYKDKRKQYAEIIDTLEYYRPYFITKKDKIDSIINHYKIKLKLNDKQETPYSISDEINTKYSEYFPVLTADGKTLYFCSNDRPEGSNTEDIYVTYFKNGKWTKPETVKDLYYDFANEAVLSVSADGNKLLIFKNGEIFETSKTKTGWSEPEIFQEMNIGRWNADAYYTADGNAILFASQNSGNIGWNGYYDKNVDIYVIVKDKNGKWSAPINLGPTINTAGLDRSPFLHPDMHTLYFSSNQHGATDGSLDVFKATRLSDSSWTEWTEPVNLGHNINTSKDEYAFRISTDGKFAIFGGTNIDGNQDIMKVNLLKFQQPEKVLTVSGKVIDENNNILSANIVWEDLETGEKVGELTSNPQTGEYFIPLPMGKNYGFYVSKEGYYPLSENIDLREDTNIYSIHKDFQVTSIKKIVEGEAAITLKNIFFEFNKFELKKESYPELKRLVEFIKTNPKIKIEISGYTDNVGNDKYNLDLSQKRADEVRKYLISQGCPAESLVSVGYGETRPIAKNTTEEGRSQNRRVEFKVIK